MYLNISNVLLNVLLCIAKCIIVPSMYCKCIDKPDCYSLINSSIHLNTYRATYWQYIGIAVSSFLLLAYFSYQSAAIINIQTLHTITLRKQSRSSNTANPYSRKSDEREINIPGTKSPPTRSSSWLPFLIYIV